jgi:hypothetical protein
MLKYRYSKFQATHNNYVSKRSLDINVFIIIHGHYKPQIDVTPLFLIHLNVCVAIKSTIKMQA